MSGHVKELLCGLDYEHRVLKCDVLLADGQLDPDARSHVHFFKAHALRQLGQLGKALSVCRNALTDSMSDEPKAYLLECQALLCHDLGLEDELEGVLEKATTVNQPAAVAAHLTALKGYVQAGRQDPEAAVSFSEAERLFDELGNAIGVSWVRVLAGFQAYANGLYEEAHRRLLSVTDGSSRITAQLLLADIAVRMGAAEEGLSRVAEMTASHHPGFFEVRHEGRALIVRARALLSQGHGLEADALLVEARRVLQRSERQEVDLNDQIRELRTEIMRGRDALCAD